MHRLCKVLGATRKPSEWLSDKEVHEYDAADIVSCLSQIAYVSVVRQQLEEVMLGWNAHGLISITKTAKLRFFLRFFFYYFFPRDYNLLRPAEP